MIRIMHAYLLLHRAFQSIPPTVIPNMVPASPTGHGELDQPDYLRPAFLPDARDILPSPTDEDEENEIFKTVTGQDLPHRMATANLPPPVRHCAAPDAGDVPIPNSTLSKSPLRAIPKPSPTHRRRLPAATLTEPPKPGTFRALVHHRSDLLRAHGPQKTWPNFVN